MFKRLLLKLADINTPRTIERNLILRLSSGLAVLIGIVAVISSGEISSVIGYVFLALTLIGNLYSLAFKDRNFLVLKAILGLAGIIALIQFYITISGAAEAKDLPSILNPLAELFIVVQVIHAFDLPQRRDLLFSLIGSASLVAIASAQANSNNFVMLVLLWLFVFVVGLRSNWISKQQGYVTKHEASIGIVLASFLILITALGVEVLLPNPKPIQTITLPSSAITKVLITQPGAFTSGLGNGTSLAEGANPTTSPGRVGGFIGFSNSLDLGFNAALSNEVVMTVRAQTPGYWVGEIFNNWTGSAWENPLRKIGHINTGSPFLIDPRYRNPIGLNAVQPEEIDTFYVHTTMPDLLYARNDPVEIFYPGSTLYLAPGDSILSQYAMQNKTIYTVVSRSTRVPDSELKEISLRSSSYSDGLDGGVADSDLQLPTNYSKVQQLANSIISESHAHGTYEIVKALESWMSDHVKYTLHIPPPPVGSDVVNYFLFQSHRGFCEQISTALVVMLRTLGIPAREAVGYVPGSFDALSDEWVVRANDAHAWVEVWYPQVGWQDTDPTATVGFANPNAGLSLIKDAGTTLASIGAIPFLSLVGLAGAALTMAILYSYFNTPVEVRYTRKMRKLLTRKCKNTFAMAPIASGIRSCLPERESDYFIKWFNLIAFSNDASEKKTWLKLYRDLKVAIKANKPRRTQTS